MSKDLVVLHVTNEVFELLKSGKKTCEYRPQTPYYLQRLEKLRDWFAYCEQFGLNSHVYVDFRKAYLPKESRESWFFARLSSISLVRFMEIPLDDRIILDKLYSKRFGHSLKDTLFYRLELAQ